VSERLSKFAEDLGRIKAEIGKAIVGQEEAVNLLLAAVFGGGHLLLEGVPGLGKTALVRTVAHVLGVKFGRIQFTPDLMPSDVTGTAILIDGPDGSKQFKFSPGPVFANLVLADEVNRATPKTQSALLESMQEGQATVLGLTHKLPDPFVVLATQNPVEMEGTYPLPEAQLDRFLFKAVSLFPNVDQLSAILDRTTGGPSNEPQPVLDAEAVRAHRAIVREVPAAPFAVRLASRLVLATQPHAPEATPKVRKYVRFGSSPRGGQALLAGAKYRAATDGRTSVSREDVVAFAAAALRHRLVLNFEAAADRVSPDDIVAEVIATIRD